MIQRLAARTLGTLILGALTTLAVTGWCDDATVVKSERWYAVLLQGRPSGWMHAMVTDESGVIVTADTLRVVVRRGTDTVTVEFDTRFSETKQGEPLEARSAQRLGADEIIQTMGFGKEGIDLATRENGRERTEHFPSPNRSWLTPEAIRKRIADAIRRGTSEIRYGAIDPGFGPVVSEVRMKFMGRERIDVLGAVVPALAWEVSSSVLPGFVERTYTDEQGLMVRSTLPLLPEVPLTVVQADRDLAQAQADPPELLARALIVPKEKIRDPRRLTRAVYRLTVARSENSGDAAFPELPDTGPQRIGRLGDGSLRVTVDLDGSESSRSEAPGDEYRRPSALIDCDDPAVRRLAEGALEHAQTGATAGTAETLRRFVHDFVTRKDLSVGFASAGQVARTAQGDCSEHAVLLAALLRAQGFPSRVASGLIYVDRFLGREGVFGYHMWTQVWLEDAGRPRWVDLDATLEERPFDAAHITLGTSALVDGQVVNDLLKLSPLLGRSSVEVIEAR